MKFQMNGALPSARSMAPISKIREEVGAENFFLFGLTTPRWAQLWAARLPADERYEAEANCAKSST